MFSGKSTYDPAKITVPVLLIQGEWTADSPPYMSHKLFSLLINTPMKRYVMIGEGTHTLMMSEHRLELFRSVQDSCSSARRSVELALHGARTCSRYRSRCGVHVANGVSAVSR